MKNPKKNVKKYVSLGLLLVLAVALAGVPVSARSPYLGDFESAYPSAVGSRIDNCNLCHNPDFSRNSFGLDFLASGFNFDATLEQKDSDGDGFKNIDEINALTFPGDINDYPALPPGDTISPVVTIISPVDGSTVDTSTVTVSGIATDDIGVIDVTVNGVPVTIIPSTSVTFITTVTLASGSNTITAVASDASGKSGTATVTVTFNPPPPPPPAEPVLTTVIVLPASRLVIPAGGTQQFDVLTLDQNGDPIAATVTWSLSNEAAGSFEVIDGDSILFTAASSTISRRTVTEVIATVTTTGGDISDSTKVVVKPPRRQR